MTDHFNLYNPASQDPEQLLAEFIDRKGLLERILDIIRHNGPDQPQQHLMLIGPRGMGKTTLLCAIKHRVDQAPERVAALRILTGGNPRLVKLGYRVLRDGLDGDLRRDLERLLDEVTPFFKHRIDSLKAKETRRVFDAIARRWDPVTVDDIRRELRKASNYVSAQIKRLIEEGFVEEAGGDKKKRYQVSERFYNIYYLMRHSREGRRRLRWLVGFMQIFYSRQDFKDSAQRLERELAESLSPPGRAEKLAQLHALSAAADNDGRAAAFAVLVRHGIQDDDPCPWRADIADSPDPLTSHGWLYPLAEVVWLLEPEARRRLGFRSFDRSWWQRLRLALGEAGLGRAESYLEELGFWRRDSPAQAHAAGVMLDWLLRRPLEAETAYRRALALDDQFSFAWNGLGNALNGQQRHVEAETAFRRALALDPQYAFAHINLAGTYLEDMGRSQEGVGELIQGLALAPEDGYGRWLLERHWQPVLPVASARILAQANGDPAGTDQLLALMTETLIEKAMAGEKTAVRDALLALEPQAQALFEPLLLALQALEDRSLVYRLAREKRELVLEVMARIDTPG